MAMRECRTAEPVGGANRSAWGFIVFQHPSQMKSTKNRRKVRHHIRNDLLQSRKSLRTKQVVTRSCVEPTKCLEPTPDASSSLYLPAERRAHEIRAFLVRRHSPFCMKVRELCFSLALFDEGSYRFALAEMALHGDRPANYTLPYAENDAALQYYSQAVSHVQQRMKSSEPYQSSSHELLGLVLGLASYDLSAGHMERWRMHMAGLELLIGCRGGLQAYPSVYFRLGLLWTEATGNLLLDISPRFNIPLDIMQPYLHSGSSPVLVRNLSALRSMHPRLHHIASMMELMTGVASSFVRQADNINDESDGDDYTVYCITRARTSYLLLQVDRLDMKTVLSGVVPRAMVIGEIIRLSAMVFLLRLAGFTSGNVPYHTDRLLQLLSLDADLWTGAEELQLWALILTAVMMNGLVERQEPIACRIQHLRSHLGLSWDDVLDTLHKIAWVHHPFQAEMGVLRIMVEGQQGRS